MAISQIICSLLLLKVGEVGYHCFDVTPGIIFVSIEVPVMTYRACNLHWDPWPLILDQKRTSGRVVGAIGCSNRGTFRMTTQTEGIECRLEHQIDTRVTWPDGSKFCSFPVTIHNRSDAYWVTVTLNCNCVPGDAFFEDFAQI
jgi:hypothetical protein